MTTPNNDSKKKPGFNIYWIYSIIAVSLIVLQMWMSGKKEVSYDVRSAFNQLADSGYVANVNIVNRDHIDFSITKKTLGA